MTATHQAAYRERKAKQGLRYLQRYVPAEIFGEANAMLDRLCAEYDRLQQVAKEIGVSASDLRATIKAETAGGQKPRPDAVRPNATTKEALADVKAGRVKRFASFNDLMKGLAE